MDSGHVASAQFGTTTTKTGITKTLTSVTRVTTTATATLVKHGFLNGATITIAGAAVANYNGAKVITVTSADVFTYTVADSGATPATGTITATGADQSVYNSTTLTNDAQLTAAIGAGESWEYEFDVFYKNTDDTTDGMSVSVTAPSGATGYFYVLSPALVAVKAIALGTGVALGSGTFDNTVQVRTVKAIVHNGATAGSVTLQFAQTGAASATQATVMAGSILKASQLFSTLVV
jgi:uncharacterized phosphosugar-binding protein